MTTRCPKVAIIGGGPGGLFTAYLLQKQAGRVCDITIFEAADRLGGKILTPKFSSAPVTYEAGAAEFYDYTPYAEDPLKALVLELGLPITSMGGQSVSHQGRISANLDDIEIQFGVQRRRQFERFHQQAHGWISPAEFYYSGGEESTSLVNSQPRLQSWLAQVASPEVETYVSQWIHSDLATETTNTNVEYGLQNYLMNDSAYMQLYGIEGGNERLISALLDRLNVQIATCTTVISVGGCENGKIHVSSRHDGEIRENDFDYVVVALPHDQVKSLEYCGHRLSREVEKHWRHFHHPAHYLRISILFDRRFWGDVLPDSYCMLDAFDGCCLYDESSRICEPTHGVLGWLLGGQAALDLAGLEDAILIDKALDSLPVQFRNAREHFVEGHVHRWLNAVNALPGGETTWSLETRHCPDPEQHARLFFVGDYLFDSTLNGVLDSATFVADWIAASLEVD